MNTVTLQMNVTQLAVARGNAYQLFGHLFRRGPAPELLPIVQAIPELAAALPAPTWKLDPDCLAADHYHLFGLNVFPYENIFLDPESNLGGPVTEAVQAFYHQAGFWNFHSNESPDQVGLELALLAFLNTAEADAWEDGLVGQAQRIRRLQRRFLDEHLLRWLPCLALAIRQQGSPFYTSLADLALALALEHRADLVLDLDGSPARFRLPPVPDLLENEKTGLKEIAHYLLTPAWSGFYFSREDITRLASSCQLPRGFGSRSQMLANLLHSAADYEQLHSVLNSLQDILENWVAAYSSYVEEGRIGLQAVAAAWLERLRATQAMLCKVSEQTRLLERII